MIAATTVQAGRYTTKIEYFEGVNINIALTSRAV